MANSVPNSFKKAILEGDITGGSDTFKIILMKDGFSFDVDSHHAYADVSTNEVANGLGYTTGGATLTGVSIAATNAADTGSISWNHAEWTADGGSIVASGAIVYDDTTATGSGHDHTDAIVSYIDFGETLTTTDGKILRVTNINVTIS